MSKIEKLGMVSSKSVHKHTGKDWDQWVTLLTKAGAQNWPFKEINLFLKKKYKLTPWWQMGVTAGFEMAIGRRIEGRNSKGLFSTTSTKTFHKPVKEIWNLFNSSEGQIIWLKPLQKFKFQKDENFETEDGFFGKVRTMQNQRRVRIAWQDPEWEKPSIIQIYFIPQAKNKCAVSLTHEQLKSGRMRLEFRERWKNALDQLAELVKSKK